MDGNDIIRRIERKLGMPGLAETLAGKLSPTDLQSLLLDVVRRRSASRTSAEVLVDYQRNRFVAPAAVSPSALAVVEDALLRQLPAEVERLELSPVCPLGTSAVVAGVSQDWSIATTRNTEVVSDATNVLALECAVRRQTLRKQDPRSHETVHVCASHRLVRPQLNEAPGMLAHFRLFCLCSAGRDTGSLAFETNALLLHAGSYLRAVSALVAADVHLEFLLTDFHDHDRHAYLEANLLEPLRHVCPDHEITFNDQREAGRGYYRDLCFHIYAHAGGEAPLQLADGGSVNWTQRLLGNAKERLVISGISAERISGLSGRQATL